MPGPTRSRPKKRRRPPINVRIVRTDRKIRTNVTSTIKSTKFPVTQASKK